MKIECTAKNMWFIISLHLHNDGQFFHYDQELWKFLKFTKLFRKNSMIPPSIQIPPRRSILHHIFVVTIAFSEISTEIIKKFKT